MTITGPNRGIGRWLSPVIVELLDDGVNVRVVTEFTYEDPDARRWTVPAGTVSDGASIPRALWSTVGSPLTGRYRRAAVLHDYLYRSQIVDKDTADRVLLDAMHGDGCDDELAQVIYDGVHLCGESSWTADGAVLNAGRVVHA